MYIFVNASHVVMLSPFLFLMLVSGICMYNDIVSKVISFQIRMLPTFDSIIFVSVDEMPEFLANFLNKNYHRRDISGTEGRRPSPSLFLKNNPKPIFIIRDRTNSKYNEETAEHRSLLL